LVQLGIDDRHGPRGGLVDQSDRLALGAPEDAEDAVGVLASIKDELPKLRDRHARVVAIFAQAGIETFDAEEDVEACVQVLADEALRARFGVTLKQFLTE
jgi:type I restriction enzyme R subunit